MEVCVRERIRLRWRFIGTCICLRESLAQRSFTRLFGRMVFNRSSYSDRKRGKRFDEWTTSLLRAACWTMASGMKLEKHVKALCGEDCKVDWCCEILSESGVPHGLRFRSNKSTEMSSVAEQITWTWSSDVNFCKCHHQLLSMVSFHVRDYTDCTEACCCLRCCLVTVGWTRPLSLGQFLLLCLCSVDCVTTVTITRQLTNFTIMLWLSICPSHLLSVCRL